MSDKISSSHPKIVSKPAPKIATKPPAGSAGGAVTRGGKPEAGPAVKPVKGPVDTVSVKGEKVETSGTNMSALTSGLASNFDVSEKGKSSPDPGQASVDLARQFEGQLSQDVKGQLPHFEAEGGNSGNCADFVSSVLQTTGRGIERTPDMGALRQQLLDKGWQAISPDQAKPGDVWMTKSNTFGNRHTELVTKADGEGGFSTIGSNNIAEGQQQIFEREKTGGVIYGYREPQPVQ